MVHRWSDCAVPRTESVTWPRESSDRSRGRGEPVRLSVHEWFPTLSVRIADIRGGGSNYRRGPTPLPGSTRNGRRRSRWTIPFFAPTPNRHATESSDGLSKLRKHVAPRPPQSRRARRRCHSRDASAVIRRTHGIRIRSSSALRHVPPTEHATLVASV